MFDKKAQVPNGKPQEANSGRRTRADRALETRRKLIDAAAKVVGEEGYANASVAKITARAEIAQGTFYNYFASQQDLFDHLLPELGREVLDFIRMRLAGETDSLRREEIGFRAYFDFLAQRPEFYRILNEAETFAPKAFHDHMRNMVEGYMRALTRSQAKGELTGFEPRELEVIVYILLAARNYLSYRFSIRGGRARRLPPWVDRAYMKFISGGMLYGGITAEPASRRRRATSVNSSVVGARTADIRVEVGPSDEAILTARLTADDHDECGNIRRSVLLDLIERAASTAAGSYARGPLTLQSLSTSFPAPTSSDMLVAIARVASASSIIHASVSVHEETRTGSTIAQGQAVYSLSSDDERK